MEITAHKCVLFEMFLCDLIGGFIWIYGATIGITVKEQMMNVYYGFGLSVLGKLYLMNVFCVCHVFVSVKRAQYNICICHYNVERVCFCLWLCVVSPFYASLQFVMLYTHVVY
eukprot:787492_1